MLASRGIHSVCQRLLNTHSPFLACPGRMLDCPKSFLSGRERVEWVVRDSLREALHDAPSFSEHLKRPLVASGALSNALAKSVVRILHTRKAAALCLDAVEGPVHTIPQEPHTSESVAVFNQV